METVVLLNWDAFRWHNCWNWCSALPVQACSGSLTLSPACWDYFAIGADIAPKGLPDWCFLLPNSCRQQQFCTASCPTAQQICCQGQGQRRGKVCCQLPRLECWTSAFQELEGFYHQLKAQLQTYLLPLPHRRAVITAAWIISVRNLRSLWPLLLGLPPQQTPDDFYTLH